MKTDQKQGAITVTVTLHRPKLWLGLWWVDVTYGSKRLAQGRGKTQESAYINLLASLVEARGSHSSPDIERAIRIAIRKIPDLLLEDDKEARK